MHSTMSKLLLLGFLLIGQSVPSPGMSRRAEGPYRCVRFGFRPPREPQEFRTNHPSRTPVRIYPRAATGLAVDWFSERLDSGRPIASSDQFSSGKELGTLIPILGMVLVAVPIGAILLACPTFTGLSSIPDPKGGHRAGLVAFYHRPLRASRG